MDNLSSNEKLVGAILAAAAGPFIAFNSFTGFPVLVDLALALVTACLMTLFAIVVIDTIFAIKDKRRLKENHGNEG